MGHSFVIGNVVVSAEELTEKLSLGAIGRFRAEARGSPKAKLEFARGSVNVSQLAPPASKAKRAAPGFTPIGIGKPLSLEILTVYSGNVPEKSFLSGNPDLLLTSAAKGIQTFEAAPRAINQLIKAVGDRQYLEPSALADGCPIIYHTRSLVNSTLLCAFEMVADTFDKKVFDGIQRLFSTAAGIPIFAPAGAYLMAGSFLTKIFADVGKALLVTPAFLKTDIPFRFDTPEIPEAMARMIILYNDKDQKEFAEYNFGLAAAGPGRQRMSLMHTTSGKEYRADAPFAIISLDGRHRPDLEDFTSRLASAAILDKFYGAQDTGGQIVETLSSAMELLNDFTFRLKAEKMKTQMEALDPNSREHETAKTLFNAYVGNIRKEIFRL